MVSIVCLKTTNSLILFNVHTFDNVKRVSTGTRRSRSIARQRRNLLIADRNMTPPRGVLPRPKLCPSPKERPHASAPPAPTTDKARKAEHETKNGVKSTVVYPNSLLYSSLVQSTVYSRAIYPSSAIALLHHDTMAPW